MKKRMCEPPDYCANCGAEIPRKARACPECGADETTGWAETDLYDGLNLPLDGESEHNDEVSRQKRAKRAPLTWTIAVLLVCVFLYLVFRNH